MKDPEYGKNYSYTHIEEWFDKLTDTDPNAEWNEYGPEGRIEMGQNFIVVTCLLTFSFVLTGYIQSGEHKGSQYKLIYKE